MTETPLDRTVRLALTAGRHHRRLQRVRSAAQHSPLHLNGEHVVAVTAVMAALDDPLDDKETE